MSFKIIKTCIGHYAHRYIHHIINSNSPQTFHRTLRCHDKLSAAEQFNTQYLLFNKLCRCHACVINLKRCMKYTANFPYVCFIHFTGLFHCMQFFFRNKHFAVPLGNTATFIIIRCSMYIVQAQYLFVYVDSVQYSIHIIFWCQVLPSRPM